MTDVTAARVIILFYECWYLAVSEKVFFCEITVLKVTKIMGNIHTVGPNEALVVSGMISIGINELIIKSLDAKKIMLLIYFGYIEAPYFRHIYTNWPERYFEVWLFVYKFIIDMYYLLFVSYLRPPKNKQHKITDRLGTYYLFYLEYLLIKQNILIKIVSVVVLSLLISLFSFLIRMFTWHVQYDIMLPQCSTQLDFDWTI